MPRLRMLLVLAAATFHTQLLAEVTTTDPTALLRAAADRISGSAAFTADFEFAVKIGLPGLEHGRYARYTVAAQRPNQFAFLRTDGDMGATMVSDGETVTQYVAELGQYTQSDAPKSLDEFSSSITGSMLIEGGMGGFMMALLADDPVARLTADVTDSQYVGQEVVDGVSCHHLRFIEQDWDFDVWVTAGDEPTLRRIRPDLSKQMGEEEREMGFSITISLEYENWNFDPGTLDDAFVFTPPASAELVDELSPRVPESPTPAIVTVHPLVGQPAPKFSLPQLDADKPFELESALGSKVIVLDFWATWCPPCVEGLPQLAEVAKHYADKPVAVYAVNIEQDADTIREFLTERQLSLPVLLDASGETAGKYSVVGIPQTVLIGLDGRVHVVHAGLPENLAAELTEAIDALLDRQDLAARELEKSEHAGASEDQPASR